MGHPLKVLVVGLGSMGKRRIRNLRALGITEIAGVDPRRDRQHEVQSRYGVLTFGSIEDAFANSSWDAMVVSTPPDQHLEPAAVAVEHRIPCFIEASVLSSSVAKLREHCAGGSLIAPSCTMRYFEGPKAIKLLIAGGIIGKPLNLNYHVGQYLPNWHPNEEIEDFYVGKRETGGCRELVPFELTWLNHVFGEPDALRCFKTKVSDLPVDIDDVYHCLLQYPDVIPNVCDGYTLSYPGMLANLTIEVLAQPQAIRELCVIGSAGRLTWNAGDNQIRYHIASGSVTIDLPQVDYDSPYQNELRDFLHAAVDTKHWQHDLDSDYRVLRLLDKLEALCQ